MSDQFFRPHENRYIPYKRHVWNRLERGAVMSLIFDYETTGIGGGQNATPNFPHATQYGTVVKDLAGNHVNQALQLDIQVSDRYLIEPEAAILTRQYPSDLRSPTRLDLHTAMGMILDHEEQAKFDYPEIATQFGDPLQTHPYLLRTARGKMKNAADPFYTIPLRADDGTIVDDARYYPDLRKVALRLEYHPENRHRGFFQDLTDGSFWIFKEPSLLNLTYNGSAYDLPIERQNAYRAGMDAVNTGFRNASAVRTNKKTGKDYHVDVMKKVMLALVFGAQGQNSLQQHVALDDSGQPRLSVKLGDTVRANERAADSLLRTQGGLRQIDGSFFDDMQAHGALYDAKATSVLDDLIDRLEPAIAAYAAQQSSRDELIKMLMQHNPERMNLPINLTVQRQGSGLQAQPLYFLGLDDHIGRFNQLIFFALGTGLHKGGYDKLDATAWKKLLERGGQGSPIKLINFNKHNGFLPLDFVLNHTAAGPQCAAQLQDWHDDAVFVLKNPQMVQAIMQALGDINHDRRFLAYRPDVPVLEDGFLPRRSGSIAYPEEGHMIAARKSSGLKGPQRLSDFSLLLQSRIDDDYKFIQDVDRQMRQLFLQPHASEWYRYQGIGLDETPHEERDEHGQLTQDALYAARLLENYVELCERTVKRFEARDLTGYANILRSITKPDGGSFFDGKKFIAKTLGEVLWFRDHLLDRAARDYIRARRSSNKMLQDYSKGLVNKHYCRVTEGGEPLLLLADPDHGEYAQPFLGDETAREISLATLKSFEKRGKIAQEVFDKTIKERHWIPHFYQRRESPSIELIAKELERRGRIDQHNAFWHDFNVNSMQHYLYTPPNQLPNETHFPRIEAIENTIKRLEIGGSVQVPFVTKAATPALTISADVLQYDESAAILADSKVDIGRLRKQYPKKISAAYHAASGLPYDYIEQIIARDSTKALLKESNVVVLDVPIHHVSSPLQQDTVHFPFKGLMIPNIPEKKRKAIKNGAPVVVRVMETGQHYAAIRASAYEFSEQLQWMYPDMTQQALAAYRDADKPLKEGADTLYYLGFESLDPVANTQANFEVTRSGLILPHNQFYGLTAPRFAHVGDQPITAAIVPASYVAQDMLAGETLTLYEGLGDMFTHYDGQTMRKSGHVYQAAIVEVQGADRQGHVHGVPMKHLQEQFKQGSLDSALFTEAGYLGADDFFARAKKWSATKQTPGALGPDVVIVRFDPVNAAYKQSKNRDESLNSWSILFNQGQHPRASYAYDGTYPAPDSYVLGV